MTLYKYLRASAGNSMDAAAIFDGQRSFDERIMAAARCASAIDKDIAGDALQYLIDFLKWRHSCEYLSNETLSQCVSTAEAQYCLPDNTFRKRCGRVLALTRSHEGHTLVAQMIEAEDHKEALRLIWWMGTGGHTRYAERCWNAESSSVAIRHLAACVLCSSNEDVGMYFQNRLEYGTQKNIDWQAAVALLKSGCCDMHDLVLSGLRDYPEIIRAHINHFFWDLDMLSKDWKNRVDELSKTGHE